MEAGDERPRRTVGEKEGTRGTVVYGPAAQERKRSRSLWSLANSWPVSAAALDRQARDLSQERRALSLTSRCGHHLIGELEMR